MRRGWTSLCIGWICALAQTAPGQVAEDLFTLESGRAGWLRELDAGLRLEPGRWPDVWRRAGDLGPVAAPVLWGKLRRDRRTRGRLLWITTYVAATGHGGQLVSGEWILEARKPERVMALIAAALAEGGVVEPAELRRLVRDTSSPALRVAGCLALSRATGATALPGDWFVASGGPDPGACAAALMCGAEPPSQLLFRKSTPRAISLTSDSSSVRSQGRRLMDEHDEKHEVKKISTWRLDQICTKNVFGCAET